MNYEEDIRIDDTALDVEWLDQPLLFLKYAKHNARTIVQYDEVKQALDIVKAEVDKDVREHPENFGIGKITEGSVLSAVITDNRYKVAFQALLDIKFEMEMAKGALRAFEQRKESLENLVRLHGQKYFAGPQVPRDLTSERDKRQGKVDAGISSKINRRRG